MIHTRTTDVGTATLIGDRILEVRIHSGIELNRDALLQGYQQLEDLAGGCYALLVDRTQSDYSVSYDAMVETANHPSLVAQALLIPPYNQHKKLIAETILDYPRKSTNPVQLFTDRNQAITWLNENLQQLS